MTEKDGDSQRVTEKGRRLTESDSQRVTEKDGERVTETHRE